MLASETTLTKSRSSPLSDLTSYNTGPADGKERLTGAFAIELQLIRPDPTQPRKTVGSAQQQELVESIRRLGMLQPITVRFMEAERVYQIITGERRYLAAKQLGLTQIPCWIHTPEEQDVLLQIAENWQRADLHPFDIADAPPTRRPEEERLFAFWPWGPEMPPVHAANNSSKMSSKM